MYKTPKEKNHSEYPVLSALLNNLHHNLHEQNVFSNIIAMYIAFNFLQLHIIISPSYIFVSLQATGWSYWALVNCGCTLSPPTEVDA